MTLPLTAERKEEIASDEGERGEQKCWLWGGRVLSNFQSYGKGYYKRRWTYPFVFSF